ncbi:unnamed protein product [Cylindrotheca closterium]|uniref:Uncharacterized protein n=1 Tax=Cylindrotheca closterium TaxID=2856 RepID=A0AAD2CHE5_9STRA|nr:unnamed protein product [Cylindrotheca closterium]
MHNTATLNGQRNHQTSQPPSNRSPGNFQHSNPQNDHDVESHYNQDGNRAKGSVPGGMYYNDQEAGCLVPVGTVPKEGQGGMPSAKEQHDQFVQPCERQEMYPPPEDSYPSDELYPPTDGQGYYPYDDASEHYHYSDEAH